MDQPQTLQPNGHSSKPQDIGGERQIHRAPLLIYSMEQFYGEYDQHRAFLVGQAPDPSLRTQVIGCKLEQYGKALEGLDGNNEDARHSGSHLLLSWLLQTRLIAK